MGLTAAVGLVVAAAVYNGLSGPISIRVREDDMDDMMNGGTSSDRGRWRGWPRRAGVLAVTAGVAVLAACSGSASATGSGSSPGAGGSQSSQLLAFAQCMRSHGVPTFPDPSSDLKFPSAQQLGVSGSRYQAAEGACQHLLPNGGRGPNQAEEQQQLSGMREISRCMRSHGVPNWPDPSVDSQGRPFYNLVNVHGIDASRSSRIMLECSRLLPRKLPLGGVPVRR